MWQKKTCVTPTLSFHTHTHTHTHTRTHARTHTHNYKMRNCSLHNLHHSMFFIKSPLEVRWNSFNKVFRHFCWFSNFPQDKNLFQLNMIDVRKVFWPWQFDLKAVFTVYKRGLPLKSIQVILIWNAKNEIKLKRLLLSRASSLFFPLVILNDM